MNKKCNELVKTFYIYLKTICKKRREKNLKNEIEKRNLNSRSCEDNISCCLSFHIQNFIYFQEENLEKFCL